MMVKWVEEKLLPPEETEGKADKELLEAVPRRIHLVERGRRYNAIGTKRWWYRKVKHNPEMSYEQIVQEIYPQ